MIRKSIVSYRWGRPRSASALARVSLKSRAILDALPDKVRRPWLDRVILSAARSDEYKSLRAPKSTNPNRKKIGKRSVER